MQKKSCFSRKVTESDAFAELSFEAQALYFQLSLAADASGFVSTPKKVQKGMGASSAALEELAGGDYLVFYESGACAITAWEGGAVLGPRGGSRHFPWAHLGGRKAASQKKKAKAFAFAFWKTGKRNYLCTRPEPSPPASFSTSLTDTRL